MIAININHPVPAPAQPGLPHSAPDERLGNHTFLRKLQAGLRSEIWLALPPGSDALERLSVIKLFFPHAPGPVLEALRAELDLAQRLSHPNVARTLQVGRDAERSFIVSEYLEGTSASALLRRLRVARERLPEAAVARVLLAIVSAVSHAEQRAASPLAKVLVNQAIAADDVFVTFDGDVKLLAFKGQLGSAGAFAASSAAGLEETSAYAAVDALLAQHRCTALAALLAGVAGARPRGAAGLRQVERVLRAWQRELGSDGRAELAAVMARLLAPVRAERRAHLEQSLAHRPALRPTASAASFAEEEAPVSGFRPIRR